MPQSKPCSGMQPRTRLILIFVISSAILAGFIYGMVVLFSTPEPNLDYLPKPRIYDAGWNIVYWGSEESMKDLTDQLDEFTEPYDLLDSKEDYKDIFGECSDEKKVKPGEPCHLIDLLYLGHHCTKRNKWGIDYKVNRVSSPCIFLKMKKIPGWVPEVYDKTDLDNDLLPKDMPENLREHIHLQTADYGDVPPMVWVSCEGEEEDDREVVSRVEYTPFMGFPAYYFPYTETPGYQPPIVSLRFVNATSYTFVVCKVWAKNIIHSEEDTTWTVKFALGID